MQAIDELIGFLKPNTPVELKRIAIDHILGLSAGDRPNAIIIGNPKVLEHIIIATNDNDDKVSEKALDAIVNITAFVVGAERLLEFKSEEYGSTLKLLISYVLDPQKYYADGACKALSNITRYTSLMEQYLDYILPKLNDLINAYVNIGYNKKGSTLNYLSRVFSNLCCCSKIRKWMTEEQPYVPLLKLLPFFNYEHSNIRRSGAIGVIRNLSFDSEYHDFLLSHEIELLTYLLTPIMGDEDYPDDEMDKLPITLQYLPKEKERDFDPDIRLQVLETLNQLCMKRTGRVYLRDNGVYYVLREHHKWETDPRVRLACENVVDILIQTEEEVGVEDFSTVEVPEDLKEKFDKMDAEYLGEHQESR